jgi:putative endonuclease
MKNSAHLNTGKKGEKIAGEFLENLGYEILRTNWRHGKSEIDIIAKKDNMLVLVEVKTRSNTAFGEPSDFVNKSKWTRLAEAAEAFAEEINFAGETRIDVVSITFEEKVPVVFHHKEVNMDFENLE